jgi:hypothetical protein
MLHHPRSADIMLLYYCIMTITDIRINYSKPDFKDSDDDMPICLRKDLPNPVIS